MGRNHVFSKVEEGNWENFFEKEVDQTNSLQVSVLIYKAFLILVSLAGLAVYAASVGAISCRMLDNMTRSEKCHVTAKPFASLWQSSMYTMLAVNGAAAAVFIQCLMLTVRLGETESAWSGKKRGIINIFSVNQMVACDVHVDDCVLKLTYRTRCYDDVVIRAQFPTPRTYSSRLRATQLQIPTRMSAEPLTEALDMRSRRWSSQRHSQSPDQEAAQQIPVIVSQGSVQIDEACLEKTFYDR